MLYCFDNCVLDPERRELRRDAVLVSVEPQVFDLLCLLIRNRGRVISRDELVADVWHGRVVSESTLYSRLAVARQAIGDSGDAQRLIRTIARKGLRFVAEVREVDGPERNGTPTGSGGVLRAIGSNVEMSERNVAAAAIAERPVLVVMPFDNLSSPNDGYLIDGLVEDITSALSRVREFSVVARQSVYACKGKHLDSRDVGRTFSAGYVVVGTLQRDGDRLRISVGLVDARTSHQLWSSRYDGADTTIFEVQDRIAGQVVSALLPAVRFREIELGKQKPPNDLAAYDCVLRGMAIHNHGHSNPEEAREAVAWFDRALAMDPNYARALAWRACAAASLWPCQPAPELLEENMRLVFRALSIDPNESEAHRIKGALHTLQREFDAAAYHLERARELNPNNAHALVKSGLYLSLMGEHEKALAAVDLAMQRNPFHPEWYWRERGIVLFGLGSYRDALTALVRGHDGRDLDHIYQAACLAALGECESASKHVEHLRRAKPEIDPDWVKRAIPYRCYKKPADLSRLVDLLTQAVAGGPDGCMAEGRYRMNS